MASNPEQQPTAGYAGTCPPSTLGIYHDIAFTLGPSLHCLGGSNGNSAITATEIASRAGLVNLVHSRLVIGEVRNALGLHRGYLYNDSRSTSRVGLP